MSQIETRKQILVLAGGYLQSLGFNGFSFQTIADSLGIKKASIHYHFKSKEEMGLALLDDYQTSFTAWVKRIESDQEPVERLTKYFTIFERFSKDQMKICPISVLSSDYHTLPESMRSKLLDLHKAHRTFLTTTIREGRARKIFRGSAKPIEVADSILAAIQGSLQASRIRGDTEPLKHIKKFVFETLMGTQR